MFPGISPLSTPKSKEEYIKAAFSSNAYLLDGPVYKSMSQ
jgi:hypothetical protein